MSTKTRDYANTTIVPFRGRDPHDAAVVFVYRNLHASTWSVMAMDGKHAGTVVGHAQHVVLDGARWRVNTAGRLRAVSTGQRNVHAGVLGVLADVEPATEWQRVSYNPFRAGHFYATDTSDHVSASRWAMFDMNGHAWQS